MNKRSRKTKGLSHRLIALLLCCICLVAATPISAVALETDTAVTGTFSEEPTEKITVEPEITVQPATTVALGDTVNPNTTTLGDTTSSDDVTTSDGTTTNPEDTGTTETDGVAGGTNTDPDGTSTTNPDSTTTPDGTGTTDLDGTTTNSEGTADGTTTNPEGTAGNTTTPDGMTANPDGTTIPDGTGTTNPDGTSTPAEGTTPDGAQMMPPDANGLGEPGAGELYAADEVNLTIEQGGVGNSRHSGARFNRYQVVDETGEIVSGITLTQRRDMVKIEVGSNVAPGQYTIQYQYRYKLSKDWQYHATLTVIAKPTPVVYTIAFESGVADVTGVAPRNVSVTQGGSVTFPDNTFTRTGYAFAGWREKDVAGGTIYPAGSSEFVPNMNTTFEAVWEVAPVGEGAQVYYLKTPTSDPDSNEKDQWGRHIGNGTVNTEGATWTGDRNIFDPVAYVTGMPEGFMRQPDGSWYMPNSGNYTKDYAAIFVAYKAELEQELGVTLTQEDIEGIYLTPHKISQNNSSNPDKHIDCTINVKAKNVYAAKFWVKLPNGEMKLADAKNYKTSDSVNKTSKAPTGANGDYPDTIVQGGITYRFDGWYNETDELVAENSWGYKPSDTELSDGTVNFYARYVRADAQLTIQKTVSGNMYDANKEFTFTVTYDSQTETFKLRKDEKKTIPNVPAGATVTVTENPDGYTYSFVSITEGVTKTDQENGVSFTMPANDVTVVINNDKTVQIDTGILLDTLPYILILGVVAVGAILLIKRRRKRDDD